MARATLDLGAASVGLQLWDTAGQERFAALARPYFRNADGVIIAYDVTRQSSLDRALSFWLQEVRAKCKPNAVMMLVGTKTDVDDASRQVSAAEAEQLAAQEQLLHFETSAKSDSHVRDAFYLLTCSIMNGQIEADPKNIANNTVVTDSPPAQKGGCC